MILFLRSASIPKYTPFLKSAHIFSASDILIYIATKNTYIIPLSPFLIFHLICILLLGVEEELSVYWDNLHGSNLHLYSYLISSHPFGTSSIYDFIFFCILKKENTGNQLRRLFSQYHMPMASTY